LEYVLLESWNIELLSKIVPKNMLSKYDVKQHKKSPPMEGIYY
jgi:hypothetical protein